MKAENTSSDSPKTVNIHDAKTHLSQLFLEASQGSPFIIAQAGKPMVTVISISQETKAHIGMFVGVFSVPDGIDPGAGGLASGMQQKRFMANGDKAADKHRQFVTLRAWDDCSVFPDCSVRLERQKQNLGRRTDVRRHFFVCQINGLGSWGRYCLP